MPDFDDEVTELEGEIKDRQDNQNKAFERLTKERDKLREKLTALEAAEAKRRRAEAFSSMQIEPKYADLYNGEDTEDSIRDWATKYGFLAEAPSEPGESPSESETPQPVTLPSSGMQPVIGGGQPSERFITDVAEAQKIAVENPAEFQRLFEKGRIKLEKLPGNR